MTPTIPAGYHTVTPYLLLRDAARAIDFYKAVFDASELYRLVGGNGRVEHAELMIGDSHIMLADEVPEMKFLGPETLGGSSVTLLLYVDDVDAVFARAISAGAVAVREVADQFYGDRSGTLTDPFGHVWSVATHKEDISPEEMDRRLKQQAERND